MKRTKLFFSLLMIGGGSLLTYGQFSGAGTGTQDNPFQITNAVQFNEIRNYLGQANDDIHFRLMNDIDLGTLISTQYPEAGWLPIGSSDLDEDTSGDAQPFFGQLHGEGFTISNLWINRSATNYAGLFGYIKNGSVDHLTVQINTNGIKGADYIGGLTGYAEGSSITFCTVNGVIDAGQYAGGLIGYVGDDSTIDNDTTTITISATGGNIGGLIGFSNSEVTHSSSAGTLETGGDSIGGLVGNALGAISNSTSSADVKNVGDVFAGNFIGGLVGTQKASVTNSSASGKITGTNSIGGLVGDSYAIISNSHATGEVSGRVYIGGLAGNSDAIENSYATGKVIAEKDYVGGLAGQSYGTVTQSYATGNVSGAKSLGGLIGVSYQEVSLSYASGNVTQTIPAVLPEGGSMDVGGLVGYASGPVTNCYATGDVSAVNNSLYVGGLLGVAAQKVTNCYASGSVISEAYSLVGGIAGTAWDTITNCVAANPVITGLSTGNTAKMHRIVGDLEFDATVVHCFALESTRLNGEKVTTGAEDNWHGADKSAGELQKESTYSEWDFDTIWTIREGHGYPYFEWKDYFTSIISSYVNDSTRGSISPVEDVAVEDGDNQEYVITPKQGFKIESVLVDGENVGTAAAYTFENVNENHTINVVFVPLELGIDNPELIALKAYPNPVKENITISNDQNIESLEVFNMLGQKVLSVKTDGNLVQLDASELATGNYILKVNSNGKIKSIKIVKQ